MNSQTSLISLQLQQSIETFRFVVDIMLKAWAFLFAVNAVVLGWGITTWAIGPIAISALITLMSAIMIPLVSAHLIPLAYSAFNAERQLNMRDPGLVSLYSATNYMKLYTEFREVLPVDAETVGKKLRAIRRRRRFIGSKVFYILVTASLFQVLIIVWFHAEGAPIFAK